ncbi:MAG: formylmethanofuran dehydrogenase subunit C [Pirellulaceae bacterium]
MSAITLTLRERPPVPLEAEVISPDTFATLSHGEICGLPVQLGKRTRRLDDFFAVEGERSDELELVGDLGQLKWLGRGMSRGRITVRGSVGMHLGAYMKRGTIEVYGDAGDWVGAEMTDGLIRIHGQAGGQVGAAYRGSLAGMRGGTIVVDGAAGLEVGMRMRRGMIVIGGPARDFAGLQMKGGTLVLCQGAEIRTGAWMVRGTILSMRPLALLPTFAYACQANPDFVRVYARHLGSLGVRLPSQASEGAYALYGGDASVPGRGEILVWQGH